VPYCTNNSVTSSDTTEWNKSIFHVLILILYNCTGISNYQKVLAKMHFMIPQVFYLPYARIKVGSNSIFVTTVPPN
jgi:hypothetical protein